jgi:YidC/Oxa1 family membrane protein insertase
MDRKSVIVLSLCFVLFVLWAQLVPVLYPPKSVVRTNVIAQASNIVSGTQAAPAPAPAAAVPSSSATSWTAPQPGAPEETLVVTNDLARYTFTSHGGGLKLVELLKYPETVSRGSKTSPQSQRVATLNAQARQPVMALVGNDALTGDNVYKVSRFTGTWPDGTNKTRAVSGVRTEKLLSNGLFIVKEFELASNYLVNARARFENRSAQAMVLPPQQWVAGTATPLNAQDDELLVGLHWYDGIAKSDHTVDRAYFDNKTLGCLPGTPLSDYRHSGGNVSWAAANNQFFFLALIPGTNAAEVSAMRYPLPPPSREELLAMPGSRTNQSAFQIDLHFAPSNLAAGQTSEQRFTLFAGPKEYRTLERIAAQLNNGLDSVMGYGGFFGFFSRLLLLSMNGLNALGLSYGLAIIAITVIIKLLFWPLTQASMRSMKRMQKLQPQMKAMQEKFKADPAKLNKKMMEFMKENKVSPLGGCLPLLLQIPVFIGFFKMVQSAIELRGASFLWAHDLSRPDTLFTIPGLDFNVNPLPLLMGGTMFWQATLTPPSPGMDPAQQKLMKYFPLIFLFMLYNYSAGLTLYWTVQNLLSIAQMKLTKAEPDAPVAAVPSAVAPVSKKKK